MLAGNDGISFLIPNPRQTGVEVCLQLGRLGMGRDALLAAILGGVLRPDTLKKHSTHPGFGRAPVTVVDIREGFGKNVARLVAGLEHITCVEETAHEVLRGSSATAAAAAAARSASGRTHGSRKASNVSGSTAAMNAESEADCEPLSPAMLIGVRDRVPGESAGRVRGVKARSLREATALEQVGLVKVRIRLGRLMETFCRKSIQVYRSFIRKLQFVSDTVHVPDRRYSSGPLRH